MELTKLTLTQARAKLDAKECSAYELVQAYVDKAKKENTTLNAYLEIFEETAQKQARAADEKISAGEARPLTGIPLAIKDNILINGHIASAASKILQNYAAVYDAHVIQKLNDAGAVYVGRANMDEFAMGSSTENSAFGVTKNPHDPLRVPGGSSGGSAAAVAGDLAIAALGTDTGGSIRQPASLCGVVGYKPTYGAVSRRGAIAMGSSLDQIGPLAKTVEDAQLLFESIRGADPRDATSLPESAFTQEKALTTIGVPRAFLESGVDEDVKALFEKSLKLLEQEGHTLVDIELPSFEYALAAYYIIMPAEVSTNLARYDGLRYGVAKKGKDLLDDYLQTRGQGFGREARRRILLGAFVLSAGYADAYYRKAAALRGVMRSELESVFEQVDCIATPTSPTPAFAIGEKTEDPLAMYAADIFTVPANLTGVPAISVPMGVSVRDEKELPVGIQFIAAHGNDNSLFSIAKNFEKMKEV